MTEAEVSTMAYLLALFLSWTPLNFGFNAEIYDPNKLPGGECQNEVSTGNEYEPPQNDCSDGNTDPKTYP